MKHRSSRAVALLAAVLATPVAALDRDDSVQPSVYLRASFGGSAGTAPALRYGLRLDPASAEYFHAPEERPAVFAVDFDAAGWTQFVLGGVPVAGARLWLSQAEEGAAAPGEGPGLRFWKWGLPQWGLVVGGGVIAFAAIDYDDPSQSDPRTEEAEPTACGDDVPQPVFGPGDCLPV